MDERRYVEEEVKEIFEKAAKAVNAKSQALSSGEGLTLAQLQEIGREVGLAPDKVAEAALAIDRRVEISPRRTQFGMPISVSRTVDLPRALTDLEWERLVGMLRQTFGARGRVESHGSLRQWNNGQSPCIHRTD